jgi:HAD superfamily hydrolase (TIGR01509 family)
MITNKEAIFWDNDGILVDTEKYYFEATRQILGSVGFELTKALYVELFLVQSKGAWHLLNPEKYSPDAIKSLKTARDALYTEMLHTKEITVEGMEDRVAALSKKYRMAIVTSSNPMHFYAIHARTNLLKYFEFVVTPGDYLKYKPEPDPYLVAIKRMGISSSMGIAIEDSRRGLISAKAAGLACIIVQNELTENSDFSEADYVVSTISDAMQILSY